MRKSLLILGGVSLLAMPFVMTTVVHAQNQSAASAPTMSGTPGQGVTDSSTGVTPPANPPSSTTTSTIPQQPQDPKNGFVTNKPSGTAIGTSSMKKMKHMHKKSDTDSDSSMGGSDSTTGTGSEPAPMGPAGAH